MSNGKDFDIHNVDCIPFLQAMEPNSIDMAVFSPPFSSLYAYTDADADMGNSRESDDEFLLHFDFFCQAIAPVIKPGRNICLHIQQVSRQKATHGFMGLFDIRGKIIGQMERAGMIYYGDVTIDKCPQAQAIRTKSHQLQFTQFHKDSMVSRPALADYLLIFKRPGENAVRVLPEVTNEEWIDWARPLWREGADTKEEIGLTEGLREMVANGEPYPLWRGIKETATLNTEAAKNEQDERHVCPLQLPLINRCIRLWSNKGETVLSPFMGVGSEGYEAMKLYRKFVGCELNPRYFNVAKGNLKRALATRGAQQSLFGGA